MGKLPRQKMRQKSQQPCSSIQVTCGNGGQGSTSLSNPPTPMAEEAHNENKPVTLIPTSPRDHGWLAFSSSSLPPVFVFFEVLEMELRALHMLEK